MSKFSLTKNLTVRISDADDRALAQLAAQAGETNRTRIVRKLICDAAGSGPYLLESGLQSFRDAVREVRATGVNLNQLVRAVNAGQLRLTSPDDIKLVQAVSGAVEVLRHEINAIILHSRNR
jgi:nitrogen fixation protein FixH